MPKTLINEIDNTGSSTSSSLTNTVYIPGGMAATIKETPAGSSSEVTYSFSRLVRNIGTVEQPSYETVSESELLPQLLKTVSDLTGFSTGDIAAEYTATEQEPIVRPISLLQKESFILAKALLNNGCFVLFHLVSPTGNTELAWTNRMNVLRDKGLYDVKFICLGEYAIGTTTYKISDVIDCAEKRGDCIALIDHPRSISYTPTSGEPDTYSFKVHKWIETNVINGSAVNSSFAAAFSPWCSNLLYNTGTKASPVYPMLPPSFSFLLTYAQSIQSNPTWLSAAGAFRGAVPGLVKPEYKYGEQDIDTLQCRKTTMSGTTEIFDDEDNVGVACNPICNIDPFGVIIWGNRTAIKNTAEEGLKATSFLNIRNLACDVKKTMWKAARRYTFEQNTLRLWLNFCSQIRPLLDQAKVGEGISAYKFVQEETTAKARLKARIIIVPIEAVEDFELSFVLEDTIETEESVG